MRKFHSHVSFEQMSGKYTKDEWVMLLSDFQDEIIRDYRARFSDALINRKYFTKSLVKTADGYGLSKDPEFIRLKEGMDAVSSEITSLRDDVISKERAARAIGRTLPGEELYGIYGVRLSCGCTGSQAQGGKRDSLDFDAVVVTPYGVFAITFINKSGTWDEDGFIRKSENLGYIMERKEAALKRKLRRYRDLPVRSVLLVTDPKTVLKDKYRKVLISSLSDVLTDIRGMGDGRRHITPEESVEIRDMLRRAAQPELMECPVDLMKVADGYTWFVNCCLEKDDRSVIGRIKSFMKGRSQDKAGAEAL